ncbi:helix-turn-helix domain-containing protein [Microbacterium rhizomatis]|uniref:HTH cro/C1-type domain-containing protein n=1 Tax=Microbacterium rhizomatis TaxID=1631477 RepID=A0A5J5J597_9MICO|nr:helix-turn-helix transcriptional regulator [Microbacterium rhizomatis]KAA9110155.1 hypothetical protein F6B43_00125 [Microbacterium rhizomatis]
MTKNLSADTKMHEGIRQLAAGIDQYLSDHSAGRRDRKWLADRVQRVGLSKTSLYRKLADPASLNQSDIWAIADAFGVTPEDIRRAGEESLVGALAA